MAYTRLYDLLPELALAETSSVKLGPVNAYNLPAGEYGLVEMYCDDENCDCRRVFIAVMLNEPDAREPLAVIAFGWESLRFYTKWYNFGRNTPFSKMDEISQYSILRMRGACLNNFSPQSDLAPAILKMLKKIVFQDEFYINRLKDHYKKFKAKVDEGYRLSHR